MTLRRLKMKKTKVLPAFLFGIIVASSLSVYSQAGCPDKPLYGLCYSPFREGQYPGGPCPTADEIEEDLQIIAGKANFIRTYGIDCTLDLIPYLCSQYGIPCYVGCHITGDVAIDQDTISKLLDIANANYPTTKGLLVGNEYISKDIFDPCRSSYLIGLLQQVKSQTDLPVSTGEEWVQWYIHPELVNAVDFIASHHYAFARSICIEEAAMENIRNYNNMKTRYPDIEIIFFETGWPTNGTPVGCAVPSEENQARFLREFIPLAKKHNIKYFIFSAFDEPWKYSPAKSYESHWGLYDANRLPKIDINDILVASATDTNFDGIVDFSDYSTFAADWLETRSDNDLCCVGDFNHDAVVDIYDLGLMAFYWLANNSE
jgi:exo-beta-1,3-glucanase (GH17 family)